MTREQQIQMMKECLDDANTMGQNPEKELQIAIAFFQYRSKKSTTDACRDVIEKYCEKVGY